MLMAWMDAYRPMRSSSWRRPRAMAVRALIPFVHRPPEPIFTPAGGNGARPSSPCCAAANISWGLRLRSWRRARRLRGRRTLRHCASGTDALVMALMAKGVGTRRRRLHDPVHFRCDGGGDRQCRRNSGLRRHRPGDVQHRPARTRQAIAKVKADGNINPRAIITVDLFGLPADHRAINAIAAREGLFVDRGRGAELRRERRQPSSGIAGRYRLHVVLPGEAARLLRRRRGDLHRRRGSRRPASIDPGAWPGLRQI